MAFVAGKPQTHKRFGGGAGAAFLFAVFAHKQKHPGAAGGVVDIPLAGGAGLVSEHAFAVDPGGFGGEHAIAAGFCEAVGGFDLGACVVAVHAQRHRQGPGQRVEAAIGTLGEQQQQLDQLLSPGACLSEHLQGLIEGAPLATLALGPAGPEIRLLLQRAEGIVACPAKLRDDGPMTTTPTPLVTREALLAFTQQLVEHYAPERVILFGSLARGEARWDSDADILVVMPFEGRHLAKIREMRRLCPVRFPLDLLVGRPEEVEVRYRGGDPVVREALDHGEMLHG